MKRALIVNATAGSGKTTTIVDGLTFAKCGKEPAKYKASDEQKQIWEWMKTWIAKDDDVIVCAFSKAIAEELTERLQFGKASTIHSLGMRIMRENNVRTGKLDTWKTANLYLQWCEVESMKDLSKAQRAILDDVKELVKVCKDNVLTEDDIDEHKIACLAMDNEYTFSSSASACTEAIRYVLTEGSKLPVTGQKKHTAFSKAAPTKGMVIDYDDMIYLPARYDLKISVDCLIVDECLPGWTPVMLGSGGSKPIQEIKIGDVVRSYDTSTGRAKNCKVTATQKIHNRKPLVKVKVKHNHKTEGRHKFNFVVCTVDHKIWTVNKGWVYAGDIMAGDTVLIETAAETTQTGILQDLCPDGKSCPMPATVESIEATYITENYVYDITVEGCHNFYGNGVLVHNCQDLSAGKLKLISNQDCNTFVFVGDPCQPTGTNVAVVKKKGGGRVNAKFTNMKIENVTKGDQVISYTAGECAFVQNGRKVLGATKKKYKGMLVCVDTTNGLHSEYTPSHHCFANFVRLRNKYAVYLMKRGNNYRVGKAKMSYGESGSGPFARAKCEGADALWILDVFDTDKEALIAEGAVAGKFGLPELGFKDPNNNGKNQEEIDAAWQFIGSNASRAIDCLIFFGRMFQYPLWSSHNNYSSMKRPMVVRACNLLNGAAVLPYTGECHVSAKEWVTISVTRRRYSGYVYSLSVDKEQLYVADGIVTHNCQAIFAFAGSMTNSFDNIAKAFDEVEVLPLTYTYRCGKAIVAEAQKIVGDVIRAGETNCDGEICHIDEADMILTEGDMLVSRVNAPLMKIAWGLVKARKPVQVVGRNIGSGLTKLINKLTDKKEVDAITLCQLVEDWREHQVKLLQTKKYDTEARQIAIGDQADCIISVAEECKTSSDVLRFIETIFNDAERSSIKLSSIHRAKGLEADNVFFYNPKNVPHCMAKTEEAIKQEWNLKFVATTRAIRKLTYVRVPEKKIDHPDRMTV